MSEKDSPSEFANYDELVNEPDVPIKFSRMAVTGIGFALIVGAVLVGAYVLATYGGFGCFGCDEKIPIDDITFNQTEFPPGEFVSLAVSEFPPSALYLRERDYVSEHMDTYDPILSELPEVVYWAKNSTTTEDLKHIESEIIEGAKLNDLKISSGERIFLTLIEWVTNPDGCELEVNYENCKYFDINYNQHRYQLQEISRDQFWMNIKKYSPQEVIDQVEGTQGG